MRDARRATGGGPTVCPFVALLEDRDRRADGPDTRNRCYAAPAPRQRELAYQAEYCYTDRFSTCAAFLDWAARNAAEPSYPAPGIEAARAAEARAAEATPADGRARTAAASTPASTGHASGVDPTLVDGAAMTDEHGPAAQPHDHDAAGWVSASAWAAFPTTTVEVEEADEPEARDDALIADEADVPVERDEATTAPKVPPALPLRRRRPPLEPIRTPGSGEWYYSDLPDREPLVRRRFSAIPPVALGLIGLLVAALVVLLLIPILLGGGRDPGLAAGSSPSPGASVRPRATPHPAATPIPTEAATPEPPPKVRTYKVRSGDSLSRIAVRFGVGLEALQCQNGIRNPNLITVGQALTIPPEGFTCAPGWRRATPTPRAPEPTDALLDESAEP